MAGEFNLTDLGNAERLVAQHGHDLRYSPGLGWLAWDGQRWKRDADGEVMRRAKLSVRAMYAEVAELENDAERKKLRNWATSSESQARLRDAVKLAETELVVIVVSEQLDADPWLLNVRNGTIDLRTGELHAHRREDLLTKLADADYAPDAKCAQWRAFLKKILNGDAELIDYVQRLVGQSLTGVSTGQVLPICYGRGANGKSTFLETLRRLLGDYGHQAPPELLTHKNRNSGGATPDLADLFGRRFVAAVETGEERRLDEPLVKQLSGGDTITARRLYGAPFTFRPTHTVWLATNHKPEIRGTDLAIWRRVALIPFDVSIPLAEQVDQEELLERFAAESAGVLRWAVDGCLAWQAERPLEPPAAVRAATEAYRDESDVVGGFVADCCDTDDPDARISSGDLYRAYVAWAEREGERPLSAKGFGSRMDERGFATVRTASTRYRVGLELREEITGKPRLLRPAAERRA